MSNKEVIKCCIFAVCFMLITIATSAFVTCTICDQMIRDRMMADAAVDDFIKIIEATDHVTVKEYTIHHNSYSLSVLYEENEDDSEGSAMVCFTLKRSGFMDYVWEVMEK